jgi:general secretion pathway protein H
MRAKQAPIAGYSLIELLVVLAIMGLIAVVAVPAVASSLERMTLSGDTRALTTELRRLRTRALDRQIDISLTVSGGAANILTVSEGGTIELSGGTQAEILSNAAGNAPPRFVVAWDGTMNGSLRLTRGGAAARISADRLTGRLTVESAP